MPNYVIIPNNAGCSRLIPKSCSSSIEEGIKAKTNDPLWFLSRQWQLGEFRARNGGKVVRAEVSTKESNIDSIKHGTGDHFEKLPDNSYMPVEPIVEQEINPSSERFITPKSWNSRQLEYHFDLKCGNTVLEAKDYTDDYLDWYSLNLASSIDFNGEEKYYALTPDSLSFRGMPNARWWEFEDGSVDLGDIHRPNLNFLSMLLTEFALIYSDDWFIIPLEQNVGSLRTVDKLVVIDTFGICSEIKPVVDTSRDEHFWSMYTLSGNKESPAAGSQLLFLPNTIAHSLKGEPIEHISISRDELANIAWAVEHKYWKKKNDGEDGEVVNRNDEEAGDIPVPPEIGEHPLYRLKSHMPRNWIPYIPVQKSKKGDIILRRGRTDEKSNSIDTQLDTQYKGQILGESKRINEEEVPAITIDLIRRFKLIAYGPEQWKLIKIQGDNDQDKWELLKKPSKRVHVWIGRNKKPGNKSASSNLRFDYLIEK